MTLDTSDGVRDGGSTSSRMYVNYPKLHECLTPGMKVLLDDGAIILIVTKVGDDVTVLTCKADNSGEICSRTGVNLPGAEADLPAMSEKDRVDICYGMTKDINYVAASFIQNEVLCPIVQTMNEIIASAEHFTKHSMPGPNLAARQRFVDGQAEREDAGVDLVAKAAVTAAEERDAAVIVVLTSHGNLPRMISAYRPNVPILALCPIAKVARQLIVHRGIHPIHIDNMLADVPEVKRPARGIQYAKQFGMVQEGQNVVVVTRETACDELTTDFASMKIATVP